MILLKFVQKNILFLIFVLFILFVGLYVRKHNINIWPRTGATFDEYAWTWQGMSLIEKGVPTSWSPHPQYKNFKVIKYQGAYFRLVTPYLEHPPLFGLVAGSYGLWHGVSNFKSIDISKIRGLALILGMLSIGFVILLVNELYGKKLALLAGLLYATIPTIAVGSKIVQNENFFIPLWLLSLWLIAKYLKKNNNLYFLASAILSSALILAKIPWIAAPFSIGIILFYNKRYSDVLKLAGFVTASFLIYFAYGFYFDKNLFLSLWGLQLNRYDIGFASIFALFQKPYLVDRFYTDGWIYWGFISLILILVKDFKKNLILASAFISYFLVFLAGIPDESGHGWYRYPFYPFLVISIALFIKEYFNKNYFLTFLFLVIVGTTLLDHVFTPLFGFSYLAFRISIIGWSLTLIPQYWKNEKTVTLAKIINFLWLFLFFALSIISILQYNEQ